MSKREDYENRTEELLMPIAEVSQVEIYCLLYTSLLIPLPERFTELPSRNRQSR